eukprot:9251596-Alexandrium_andersonii.AAC.1
MSASLVGSEMCIRDRSQARSPELSSGWCCGIDRAYAEREVVRCAGLGVPVSYTHLTLPTICSV